MTKMMIYIKIIKDGAPLGAILVKYDTQITISKNSMLTSFLSEILVSSATPE